jgi:hypothetical protein
MIRTTLQTALTAAGCTLVLYESTQLANVTLDSSTPASIVGLVLEPDTLTLELKGNSIQETYPPTVVEILKQVRPEDLAINNEATLQELLTIAKAFIYQLVRGGAFAKIPNVPVTKVFEKRYDANVIGWSLALTLKPVVNAQKC